MAWRNGARDARLRKLGYGAPQHNDIARSISNITRATPQRQRHSAHRAASSSSARAPPRKQRGVNVWVSYALCAHQRLNACWISRWFAWRTQSPRTLAPHRCNIQRSPASFAAGHRHIKGASGRKRGASAYTQDKRRLRLGFCACSHGKINN